MWEINNASGLCVSSLNVSHFVLPISERAVLRRQVRLMPAFLAGAVVIAAHLSLALMFIMNTVSGFHQLSETLLSLSGLASLLKTHYFQLGNIYLLIRAYSFPI